MFTTMKLPNLNEIKINDSLWSHYTSMVSRIIIPYQWNIINDQVPDVELSHCLDNFRIAAGEKKGEHKGVVFIDTDVYKWLESVSYCIHNGTGGEFEEIADEVIGLIGRAQQSDGYLNTYYTVAKPDLRWTNLVEGHELYSAGHLIEAAIAYYNATGKDGLLIIARRFADLICSIFGREEGQIKGYPGHQEIELALVKLYRLTKEYNYLECAKYFIEERGAEPSYFKVEIKKRGSEMIFNEFNNYDLKYSQSHLPVKEQCTAEGHAVRATYMYCAMVDLASEYNDEEMLSACKLIWSNITQKRMYITGGIGSSGYLERFTTDYHLPNSSGYCETCASIGLAQFARRMFMIEKNAEYYDVIERALYNTILAGISADGEHYFYVNPLDVWPESCGDNTDLSHVKPVRQKWFDVACCPTNVSRTLASLGEYIYMTDDKTIYINLFISSSINSVISNKDVRLKMNSSLMKDGKVVIKVNSDKGNDAYIAIRIPHYANDPTFLLDGIEIQPLVKKSYAYIKSPNENSEFNIEIRLNVKPQWIYSNINVRENIGKAAMTKGPFVFCLEETDNSSNLSSLYVDLNNKIQDIHNTELPGELQSLSYEGFKAKDERDGQLYKTTCHELEPVSIKAVPYCIWGNRKNGEMLVWQKIKL